jgi:hypothetical protein
MCPIVSKKIDDIYCSFFEAEHISNQGNKLKVEGLFTYNSTWKGLLNKLRDL